MKMHFTYTIHYPQRKDFDKHEFDENYSILDLGDYFDFSFHNVITKKNDRLLISKDQKKLKVITDSNALNFEISKNLHNNYQLKEGSQNLSFNVVTKLHELEMNSKAIKFVYEICQENKEKELEVLSKVHFQAEVI
ncbi:hypothetical protein [Mycoplasma sp. Ms02]|uniref:hypothetical protein n=1 Tax=Mycoplasma sp. Ms02 TaxID=353851 RepID=UPI001C8A4793|nr:hypothetical protein [Mycoplasma sp. Ms02]QZE12557.1 hypothetical protein K4L35_01020 [Mycoplasma sp. Ms02]